MEQKNGQSVYEVMTKYAGEPINMKLSMSSYYLRPIKTIGRVYFIGFIPKSERICPRIRRNST